MKISIGDVVMVTGQHADILDPETGNPKTLLNRTGVVKQMNAAGFSVEFYESLPGMHNCNGHTANGRGWHVPHASVTKMAPIKDVLKNLLSGD